MVISVYQWYQSLYHPTNAHNVKNVELLKHIKIMEVAPTCFGLQKKPSSGIHSQCLVKIKRLVQCWYRRRADISAMCVMCVVHCASVYACTVHNAHSTAAIPLTTSARRLYQHWTNLVILAKHWLWLPDDGFFVNRNMLEQSLSF